MGELLRRARGEDVPGLVALRRLMFAALGLDADGAWVDGAAEWFARKVDDEDVRIVVVEADGKVVSCGLAELRTGAPGPGCPSGRTVYVSNLVTEPQWRGRGCASRCLESLLAWAAEEVHADRAELHASPDGMPLYVRTGFVETANPSMRLRLR